MPSAARYATALAIWVIVILGLMVLVTISKSEASEQTLPKSHPHHDWYAGRSDPVSGHGCCGDGDCAPVPLDADWVQPVEGGFQVSISAEQAQGINPNADAPINVMVPWDRVMLFNAGKDSPIAIYHICIWDNQLKCLFVVPGT